MGQAFTEGEGKGGPGGGGGGGRAGGPRILRGYFEGASPWGSINTYFTVSGATKEKSLALGPAATHAYPPELPIFTKISPCNGCK